MKTINRHKMLGKILRSRKLWSLLLEAVFLIALLSLAFGAWTWNRESVFFGREVYFTDGDCYARMTRVRMLEENGFGAIRHHSWENFPQGTTPHTTMPLDALIFGLSKALRIFTDRHLELAGAWISPLLGIGLVVFLAVWSAIARLPYRRAMLILVAVSPIMAHGFQVGRPDHQSLLMFLIGIALAAEVEIRKRKESSWGYVSAVAWALALWVSLFEPLILLALVLLNRIFGRLRSREVVSQTALQRFAPAAIFCGLLALAFLVDGWRAATFHPAFARWAMNIGELHGAGWMGVLSWCGWLLAVAPVILLWRWLRSGEGVCGLWLILLAATLGLSLYHARWGYFLALVFAMSLPWILSTARWRIVAWMVFIISLWPSASEWDRRLFAQDEVFRMRAENLADAVCLREAALALRERPLGGVIAPWWFCPAIVWWSGQSCLGGSSHQSLPGIIDTCEFYLASKPDRAVLDKRHVSFVFAYDPSRVVSNSEQILGRRCDYPTMAERLYSTHEPDLTGLKRTFANRFFKVYEVSP